MRLNVAGKSASAIYADLYPLKYKKIKEATLADALKIHSRGYDVICENGEINTITNIKEPIIK